MRRRLRDRIKMSRHRKTCPKRKTKHHLRPRSRGGSSARYNILILDAERHALLHKIFGNRTLTEIIEVLIRIARAKQYEREDSEVRKFYRCQ